MALTRRTPLKSGGALKRTPMKRKRATSGSDFHPAVRGAIERRSGDRCEAANSGCQGRATMIHHIRRRSQGGEGVIDNGLHVCAQCHQWIHEHPKDAAAKGWLILRPDAG